MELVERRQTETVRALVEVEQLPLQHRHRGLALRGSPGIRRTPDAASLAHLRILEEHAPPRAPVSDEVFEAYRRFYAYERMPLDVKAEVRAEPEDWTDEQVSIAGAYQSERVPIKLLLPKNAAPP